MTILDGSSFNINEFSISESYSWKDEEGHTATAKFVGTGRSIVKSKTKEIARVEGYLLQPEQSCKDDQMIPIIIYRVGVRSLRAQRTLHLMKDGRAFIL